MKKKMYFYEPQSIQNVINALSNIDIKGKDCEVMSFVFNTLKTINEAEVEIKEGDSNGKA